MNNNKNLTALVIGCETIAGYYHLSSDFHEASHGNAYLKSKAYGDLYFYDINPKKSNHLAKIFNGIAIKSLEEISDIPIDVASICTPTTTHFNVVKKVYSELKPKVIFLEKPVCSDAKELKGLLDLASKVPIVVNHTRRFWSSTLKIKEMIKAGAIGSLENINVNYYGGISNLGVHVIDFLYYLFDLELTNTQSSFHHFVERVNEPCLEVVGQVGNGKFFMNAHSERNFKVLEIDLFFTKGRIRVENFGKDVSIYHSFTNSIGENHIKLSETIDNRKEDPLLNAVGLISKYLQTKNSEVLRPYKIQEAEKVMKKVWEIANQHESKISTLSH